MNGGTLSDTISCPGCIILLKIAMAGRRLKKPLKYVVKVNLLCVSCLVCHADELKGERNGTIPHGAHKLDLWDCSVHDSKCYLESSKGYAKLYIHGN